MIYYDVPDLIFNAFENPNLDISSTCPGQERQWHKDMSDFLRLSNQNRVSKRESLSNF